MTARPVISSSLCRLLGLCGWGSCLRRIGPVGLLVLAAVVPAYGQTTSIRRRTESAARVNPPQAGQDPRLLVGQGNPAIERHSFSAVKVKPPRLFKVHDLITIIIREQKRYESDGELETKKKFELRSRISAFPKIDDGILGASTFPNGTPDVNFRLDSKIKNESGKDREDRFTTRLTASVIDIKPNGNLILEARARIQYDNEDSLMTFTGSVRSQDVTPDNTVLSTQVADKNIVVVNQGAVRDGSRRGWLTEFLDLIRPF